MNAPANLFGNIPSLFPGELLETLAGSSACRIERIVSRGHASPPGFWYDQPQHEWVVVLKGAARLSFADQAVVELGPGDYLVIPAHKKHRVEWTSPHEETIWVAVHYPK